MMKRFLQRENTRMYHVWLRSFMVCLCLALAGVSAWGQDNSYTFSDGIGTEDNPYLISSVEDLKEMVKMNSVPAHFRLNKDIDLGGEQWTPLNWVSYKEVVFDGAGNSITGLYIDGDNMADPEPSASLRVGLFSTIEHITIKNLTVEGEIINAKGHVGGICGYFNNAIIENCCNKVSITAVGAFNEELRVGGIAGNNEGEIIKCKNERNIKIEGTSIHASFGVYIGGIFGAVNWNGSVSECCNNGMLSISATIDSDVYVGGICGLMRYVPLENCYNQGAIDVSKCSTTGVVYVGGIIGKEDATLQLSTRFPCIKYCYNTGDLTGGNYVGGICGSFEGDNKKEEDVNLYSPRIEYCYNMDDLTGGVCVGGICGLFKGNNNRIASNCYLPEGNIKTVGEQVGTGAVVENTVVSKNKIVFTNGEVAWLLRQLNEEDRSYVFGQNLNGNPSDEYPKLRCFDETLPAVYQLTLHKDETKTIQYCNSGNLNLPKVAENFGWFDSDGNEYFDDSQITEDLVLTVSEKKKYTVTVKVADGCEGMGTVTGDGEYAKGDPVTITATSNEGYELDSWDVEGVAEKTKEGNTIKFTMPANNVTVTATFTEKEDPTDPEEPVDPPVDPINYYNIYNETTYDFIDVSFSRNVVREGGSVNVYLGIPEGLDPAAVTLMFKRSLYGGWENLNTDDDGNYLINNIWTDIYVKAVVDESYIDPNPDENHIYIDLSETNDSIWLYTDHKLVEEGKTAVIQAEVAKSCQNKEIRYMYKRTVLGEWKEMPKDYSINQYVVRDITTDIYVKAYFVFDKQDPTTAKNPHHVYADITATCEGLYLDATRHKVADEGDTKVFLYVKKGFETKDARYLFKRGLKGEWEDLVPGIEQNTFQVTDIEGDIYLKGIDAVYTGTEDIDGMVRVYTKDGSLFVYTAQPEEISVVSMTGVTVKRTRQTGLQSYPLNQGIYVVCVGEQVFKVRVK